MCKIVQHGSQHLCRLGSLGNYSEMEIHVQDVYLQCSQDNRCGRVGKEAGLGGGS